MNVKAKKSIRRILPFGLLILLSAICWSLGLQHYLSFEALKLYHEILKLFVLEHPFLSAMAYVGIYIVVVALSIPGAAFMTITGGFLFGSLVGTLCVVISATIGATILFLMARMASQNVLVADKGSWRAQMEKGFQESAFSYLLVLRLIPLFPFVVVNLAAAFFQVPLRSFFWATLLGIIPGSFVYVLVGTGVDSVFDQGGDFSLGHIWTPELIAALIALAMLALLPVIYQKYKK